MATLVCGLRKGSKALRPVRMVEGAIRRAGAGGDGRCRGRAARRGVSKAARDRL